MANLPKRKACIGNSVVLKGLALFWVLISLKNLVYLHETQMQSHLLCLMYNSRFLFNLIFLYDKVKK